MRDYEVKAGDSTSIRTQPNRASQAGEFTAVPTLSGQRNGFHPPLSLQSAAASLMRLRELGPSNASHYILQLQRQYGNRYVQRVTALSRRKTAEPAVAPEVESAIERKRGSGQAMNDGLRAQMESAFGADFGGVRIHSDGEADTLNRALDAVAFTSRQDIFFRTGAYDPGSSAGRELLAHELTHVVQQSGSSGGGNLTVGEPDDQYEREAHSVAQQVAKITPGTAGAGKVGLQRMCSECEKEVRGQPQEEEKEEPTGPGNQVPGTAGTVSVGLSASPLVIQRQPTIRQGVIGCPVPEAQELLNANGAALAVDGNFGSLTDAATRTFQRAHPPMPVDGIIGPLTWAALHTATPGDFGLPTGETTASHGWSGGGVHQWRQQLTPTTTSFRGCQVREADGGGGTDTCFFPGSTFAPFTAITGGTWDVDRTNHWGDDFVGWFAPAVTFYRTAGRAPCRASFTQSMRVVRPGGDVEYRRNLLVSEIGTTTVSSTRDGQTQTRTFP